MRNNYQPQKRPKKKGKRNKKQVVDARWEQKEQVGKEVKDKFLEARLEKVRSTPINCMNQQQAEYVHNLRTKPYNIACGFAGTSKTYLATRVAIEEFLKGNIEKIVIARPATSASKSLGFFGGDKIEKVKNWILPVLDVLEEFLGKSHVEYLISKGQIEGVPLETIKGRSFKNCFIIMDESQDMMKKEIKNCITRLGTGSTMVFAGDIRQIDLQQESGLKFLIDKLATREKLQSVWGVVDFDDYDEIVRSEAVKNTIIELAEMGEM